MPRVPGDPQQAAPIRRGLLTPSGGADAPASLWSGVHRPLTIGIISLITLMAFEAVGTATAMPLVAADLDALGAYTWAFSAYVTTSLLAMVACGLWSDARGPRGPLLAGVASFVLGTVVAGAAPILVVLVAGRMLQGLGSGAVVVAVYVLIARAYDIDLRPKAYSVLAAAWIVPSLVGPLVAGWLAENVSWRAVFWIVPILVIPPVMLLFPRLGAYEGGSPPQRAGRRLIAGAVATAGLLLAQDGLLRLSAAGVLEAAVGLVALVWGLRALLPAGALRLRRGLPASITMRGIIAAAFFSAEVFVPLALVETRGLTVTAAGLILATSAVCWSLGSYAQSRLPGARDRSAAVRTGAGVVMAGLLTLPLVVLTSAPPWIAGLSWALAAFGMGLSVPSISVQVMRLSPEDAQGANSAGIQVIDAVGSVVAISLLGVGHAVAVAGGGATASTYAWLWVGSAAIAAIAVVLAGRMRPAA